MFDKYYNVVTLQSVIEPSKQTDFQNMMVREYDLQVDPFRDYDDDYKSNPESCGLISHGLISQYSSYDYAEGNPQVFIPVHVLNPS
jgi:hypothetical protein